MHSIKVGRAQEVFSVGVFGCFFIVNPIWEGSGLSLCLTQGKMSKEREEWVDPNLIRFTHSKIKPIFSDGRPVEDTLQQILKGELKIEQIPKIVVYKQDDKNFYSMNNRRLWVFKECRNRNFISSVPVRVRAMPNSKRQKNKFAPERCALSAKFMRIEKKDLGTEEENEEDDEED